MESPGRSQADLGPVGLRADSAPGSGELRPKSNEIASAKPAYASGKIDRARRGSLVATAHSGSGVVPPRYARAIVSGQLVEKLKNVPTPAV